MRTLKLVVAYDGTAYAGWQRQENAPTIQAAIEDAFEPFLGHRAVVAGAGRTDAGVHALAQVASLTTSIGHDVSAILRGLNQRLPVDIRVREVTDASPTFHARFDAIGKTYRYRIATAPVLSPFDRWFVWHQPYRFRIEAMRAAAQALVGRHDFAAFQGTGTPVSDTTRTVTRLDIVERDSEIQIEIEADGFLRYMVRNIVGTLVDVSAGRRSSDSPGEALASRRRDRAGETAPALGLVLVAVKYTQDDGTPRA